MKKLILFILFFLAIAKVFACRCVRESIAQSYLDADVVALITIDKTYGEKENNPSGTGLRTYSADVKFEKIYKGTAFKILSVFGTSTYASSGACEKLVEKGEKYIILLTKNKDGDYFVSSCSTMPQISDDKFVKEYESIFKIIEKNKANLFFSKFVQYEDLSRNYNHQTKQISNDFLKLNKKRLHGKLGIYKVKINEEERISEITPIQKIGIKEKQIQELMKKNLEISRGTGFKRDEYYILLEL